MFEDRQGDRAMNDLQRKTGSLGASRLAGVAVAGSGGLARRFGTARRGLSAIEVMVVLAIVVLFGLFVIMMLPRRREDARMARCQMNLMQIGVAISLYDQAQGFLPYIPELGVEGVEPGVGPLKAVLMELGRPDLSALTDAKTRPPKLPDLAHDARRVAGFTCPSDPQTIGGELPRPGQLPGHHGRRPRRPHRPLRARPAHRHRPRRVDRRRRLHRRVRRASRRRRSARAPLAVELRPPPAPLPDSGCPRAGPTAWLGDAGTSWVECTWRSTLYNHALTPNAEPSCIADDRRAAFMGASSGHVDGVNLLFLDGSVRTFTPQVNPKVWREWATVPHAPSEAEVPKAPE